MHTTPTGTRAPAAPPHWPFGQLTPAQQRAHQAQLDAMRAGLLAKLPEALL